jgi:hypothetical protein
VSVYEGDGFRQLLTVTHGAAQRYRIVSGEAGHLLSWLHIYSLAAVGQFLGYGLGNLLGRAVSGSVSNEDFFGSLGLLLRK